MRKTHLMLMITAMLALSACKKDDATETPDDAAAPTGMLGAATDKARANAAVAALPQPDANKPLSSYPEIESGMQVMFLYVAASRLPPDYTKLAETFSSEYRGTSDSFRKNDLMQAIKPQLEEKIAIAKSAPYGWMEIEGHNGTALTIHGYAYDQTPGTPIPAGVVPEPGTGMLIFLGLCIGGFHFFRTRCVRFQRRRPVAYPG